MAEEESSMEQNTDINCNSVMGVENVNDHKSIEERGVKECRTRRVGSVTFGITLVCYGILFLIHIFLPTLRYYMIFRCWPVIFILLGGEILVENRKCNTQEWKMVYDFAAILMLGIMLLFAMIMAIFDFEMAYEMGYGTFGLF